MNLGGKHKIMSEFDAVYQEQINVLSQQKKEAEQKDLLEALRKKNTEKKQEAKRVEEKLRQESIQKISQQQEDKKQAHQIRVLENAAKILKTQISKLSNSNLKNILPQMQKTDAQALKEIIKTKKIEFLQKKYQQIQQKGIYQTTSKEMATLRNIAKYFNVPIDQLDAKHIKQYFQNNLKNKRFTPKKATIFSSTKNKQISTNKVETDSQITSNIEQLGILLKKLKNKKNSIQKEIQNKTTLNKKLKPLTQNINKLETELNKPQLKEKEATEKIESLRQNIEKQLRKLQNNQKEIKQKLAPTRINPTIKALDSKIQQLQNKINQLKTSLIVEKEIKQKTSKEFSKIQQSANKQLQQLQAHLKECQGLKQQHQTVQNIEKSLASIKSETLKQELKEQIKTEQKIEESFSKVLKNTEESFSKEDLSRLIKTDLKTLNLSQLKQFLKAINKNSIDLEIEISEQILQAAKTLPTKKKVGQQLASTLKNIKKKKEISERIAIARQQVTDRSTVISAKVTTRDLIKKKDDDEKKIITELLSEFNDLESEEDQTLFIIRLRQMYSKGDSKFKTALKLLIKTEALSIKQIEEELGFIIAGQESSPPKITVNPEVLEILEKLFNINPELIPMDGHLQQILEKGRIDRISFAKYFNKKVSKESWDYGVLSFNKSTVGFLKERAELNSLLHFWKMMSKFSKSDQDDDIMETIEIFLEKTFSLDEMDLISLFLLEFEEQLVDPSYHLFDIYEKYLQNTPYKDLPNKMKEEVVLAVLIRMLKSFPGDIKTKKRLHSQLMEYCSQEEDSLAFNRSVEVLEYYFSLGGTLKKEYLDLNKPLNYINEESLWDESKGFTADETKISQLVTGYKTPTKHLPKVKLDSISERIKKRK